MPEHKTERNPPRQWQLTLTETSDAAVYRCTMRWRTFPCRANEWHGNATASVFCVGAPIRSGEDLEGVLSLFIGADWEPVSPRSLTRPHRPR